MIWFFYTHFLSCKFLFIVRRLTSVSNVQVIKYRKSECQIPQGFCVVLILDTFQFISEELIEKEIEGRIGNVRERESCLKKSEG